MSVKLLSWQRFSHWMGQGPVRLVDQPSASATRNICRGQLLTRSIVMTLLPPEEWILRAAGIGQVVLALASLAIPRELNWVAQTKLLRPLTRQVFWTYAGYIWFSNMSSGLLSTFLPGSLVDGSPLAVAVSGFIAIWWAARLAIQFTCFDRSDVPAGTRFAVAEAALVTLFVALTITYSWTALSGLTVLWSVSE
ncbi:MAG: hypothetical protein KDA79_21625 [Planctomycetaceae bacterium]|nr:hypothetical protein [Planctomycetaceae bacterium]